jgi:hypothetical protein
MVRRYVRYHTANGINGRVLTIHNIYDILKEQRFLDCLGYDSFKEFMVDNGSKTHITEKTSRKAVYKIIQAIVEYMKDELLNGEIVSIDDLVTMAVVEATIDQKRQLIKYFENDYLLMSKSRRQFITNHKRVARVFATRKMRNLILEKLKNGKSYRVNPWL